MEDMTIYQQSLILSVSAIVIFFAGYLLRWFFAGKKLKEAEQRAEDLVNNAYKEAENRKKEIELQGKDLMLRLRQDFEKEVKERREEIVIIEKRLLQKEESLDKRVDLLEQKEKEYATRLQAMQKKETEIARKRQELTQTLEEEKQRLQKISSLTQEEARKLLLARIDEDLLQEKAVRIRRAEEEIKETVDKKARDIISNAIQRCASEHTAATTVTVVMLPSDEMKGRIIGREGRNIRALEAAAGVDIIIDDTPEAVTISGFDMFKREIARIALENLIADGRIHPGRIEEVVEKAKKEMDNLIKE